MIPDMAYPLQMLMYLPNDGITYCITVLSIGNSYINKLLGNRQWYGDTRMFELYIYSTLSQRREPSLLAGLPLAIGLVDFLILAAVVKCRAVSREYQSNNCTFMILLKISVSALTSYLSFSTQVSLLLITFK